MKKYRKVRTAFIYALGLALGTSSIYAQAQAGDYPNRPVTIVVPYGAGGSADILARALGDKLSQYWKQSVIVENRPGGVGTIGIMSVVKSKADGYTLVSVPVSDLAVNPHLYKKRPFDVFADLDPVSQVGAVPNVLIASAELNVKDPNELIRLIKERETAVTYSSPGVGSQGHIAAEIFAKKNQVVLTHIPYNSVSSALTDVVGGHVDIMFAQLPAALPFINNKGVTVLGMAAEKRSSLFPELATVEEVTGKQYGNAVSWSGLMAPKGTPLEVREKIAKDIQYVFANTDLTEKLASLGTVGVGSMPAELEQAIKADYERYGAVISELKISLD